MDSQRKGCELDGKKHSHGSEVCDDDQCVVCNDSRWEREVFIYPPERAGLKDM